MLLSSLILSKNMGSYSETIWYLIILAVTVFVFFIWNNRRLKRERNHRSGMNFRQRYEERKKQATEKQQQESKES